MHQASNQYIAVQQNQTLLTKDMKRKSDTWALGRMAVSTRDVKHVKNRL